MTFHRHAALLIFLVVFRTCMAQTPVAFSYVSLPSDSSFGYGWSACVVGSMLANMTGVDGAGGTLYSISNVTATRTWIDLNGSVHVQPLTVAQSTPAPTLYQSSSHVFSFTQDVHFISTSVVLFADSASVNHSTSVTLTLNQTTGLASETSDTGASPPANRILNLTLSSVSPTEQACLLPQNVSFFYAVIGGPRVVNDVGNFSVCTSGLMVLSPYTVTDNLTPANLPAHAVLGASGVRMYTDSTGTTVQSITGVIPQLNYFAGIPSTNLVYTTSVVCSYPPSLTSYMPLDCNNVGGILFQLDGPAILAEGSYPWSWILVSNLPNVEIFNNYGLPNGNGFVYSFSVDQFASTCMASTTMTMTVWSFSYTITGVIAASNMPFTVCTTGLITLTASAVSSSYNIIAINGTRQYTVGPDYSPAGSSMIENIVGLCGGQAQTLLTKPPFLSSQGLTFCLDGSTPSVMLTLSSGELTEQGLIGLAANTSSSGFRLENNRSPTICPAQRAWSFCFVVTSTTLGPTDPDYDPTTPSWQVVSSGTMYTNLDARQGAANPRNFLWYYNEGQYFVITNITGRRNQTVWNADGTLRSYQTNGFVGVLDPSSAVPLDNGQTTDNHLFSTFPYLDQWGTMFQMDGPITMPGGLVIDWLNWWGETISESHSDRIGFSFFRLQPLSTQEFLEQTSTGLDLTAPCTLESSNANLVQLPFSWSSVPTDLSYGNWTAFASGTITAYGPMGTTTPGRSAYTIRGVVGTRVFAFANGTQCSQQILGASDKGYDLTIYSNSPYILAEAQLVFLLGSSAIFADSDAQTGAGTPYGPYVILLNPADYYTNAIQIEESGGRLQTETSGQFFQTVSNPANVVSFAFSSGQNASSNNLGGGAIAGIVIGCVVGCLLLVATFAFCWRAKTKSLPISQESSSVDRSEVEIA